MGHLGSCAKKNGNLKWTTVKDTTELFCEQPIPYVYPLFKAHKMPLDDLRSITSSEVHSKLPSRLVVGMGNCQMSRVQCWLEHLLTPLSVRYGAFEYLKDSSMLLECLESVKNRHRSFDDFVLFSVDVKALYPSVRLDLLREALLSCFAYETDWEPAVREILADLILYTLENQQQSFSDLEQL